MGFLGLDDSGVHSDMIFFWFSIVVMLLSGCLFVWITINDIKTKKWLDLLYGIPIWTAWIYNVYALATNIS